MSAWRSNLLGIAAALLCILVPLAVAPWFHSEFRAPKLALVLALGIPAALLALNGPTRRALGRMHALLALALPSLVPVLTREPVSWAALGTGLAAGAFLLVPLHLGAATGAGIPALRALARALGMGALLVLAIGVLRRWTHACDWIPDRADVAFSATIGNSNEVAEYAAPIALLLFLLPRPRFLDLLLGASAAALVVLSESRAGLLVLGLGSVVGGVQLLRCGERKHGVVVLGSMAVIAALLLLAPAWAEQRQRALTIFDPDHPSNAVRLSLWRSTTELSLASQPLGVGPGHFEAAYPRFREAGEWQAAGRASVAESPHNEFLWLASELGLGGVLLCIGCGLLLVQRVRRLSGGDAAALPALTALFLGCALLALVRSPFHHPCGTLALGLAGGWLLRTTSRDEDWSAWWGAGLASMLLLAAACMAFLDVREDLCTGTARRELVAADHWFRNGAPDTGIACTLASAAAVREVATAPFTTQHAFRAAVVAAELDSLAEALRSTSSVPEALEGMGDRAQHLLRFTLRSDPAHVPARLLLAEVLQQRSASQGTADGTIGAEDCLREGIAWIPQAPGLRARLAELLERRGRLRDALLELRQESPCQPRSLELAGRLGRLELMAGGGLPDSLRLRFETQASNASLVEAASHADAAGRSTEAMNSALRALAAAPFDETALDIVVRHGYAAREEPWTELAARATARAKYLLAEREARMGDLNAAKRNLRLALARDPALAPALMLHAALLADGGERDAARRALTALRDLVQDDGALRSALEAHPLFARPTTAALISEVFTSTDR
jgi:tetratricopeptide (TPR) repeat protein